MIGVTPSAALRSIAVDPQVNRLRDHRERQLERERVAQIIGMVDEAGGAQTPAVELPFAGGKFRFRLGELEIVLLELGYAHPLSKAGTKAPPMRLGAAYARLVRGRYLQDGVEVGVPGEADFSVIEVTALIRMALLGGGGGTIDGRAISWRDHDVDTYLAEHIHPLPLLQRWDLALAALGIRMQGRAAEPDDE